MDSGQHCDHCTLTLGLGPRAKRILLMLIRHKDWELDHLSGIRLKFLNGADPSRVTYQEIGRERCEEAA